MKKQKEKLLKYLRERRYFELEEQISGGTTAAKRTSKAKSARQKQKTIVKAIKRFQTFSALPATGRVNQLTVAETEKARCSFPDVSADEQILAEAMPPRWHTTNITYSFRFIPQQLPMPVVKNVMLAAFNEWRRVFPAFFFQEVELDESPLIGISFVSGNHADGFPFRGGDGDLGHAFLPNHPTFRGEIHFDDNERWSVDNPATFNDLVTVAIHEIGHALGLTHSPNENALMFAAYRGLRRKLHPEDIQRIRQLYH